MEIIHLNTTLAFEYSTVDADIVGEIDSVLKPSGGVIRADSISELIIEKDKVNPDKTKIGGSIRYTSGLGIKKPMYPQWDASVYEHLYGKSCRKRAGYIFIHTLLFRK